MSSQLSNVILIIIVQEIRRDTEVIVELLESKKDHLCNHITLKWMMSPHLQEQNCITAANKAV
jgi:hypothetical protein